MRCFPAKRRLRSRPLDCRAEAAEHVVDVRQVAHRLELAEVQHTLLEFLVQVWDGKVNFYLNSEPMQTGFEIEPEQPISRDSLFGFGNQLFVKGNTTYVRNIEMRQPLRQAPGHRQ